ncbi:MAG: hypothetical protein J6M12_02750 [Clostridia bacterium]|nr:hypothetical protein [Clostridia bacterium]
MKKILAVFLSLLLCASACGCSMFTEKLDQQYDKAYRSMKQGNYEEAIELFLDLGKYKDAAECAVYCEALSYCSIGDYESAYVALEDIPDYPGTKALLKNIYYESRAIVALQKLRSYMKNPDSLSVTSISFRYDEENYENPPCIMWTTGQNGLGGYSTSYVLCTYSEDTKSYIYLGSCDTLDVDDADDYTEKMIIALINYYQEDSEVSDAVDIDRVSDIISEGKLKKVSIIDDLSYDMIAESTDLTPDPESDTSTKDA